MVMGRFSDIVLRRFAVREEEMEMMTVSHLQRSKSISSVNEVKRMPRRQGSDPFPLGDLSNLSPCLTRGDRGSFVRAVNTVKSMQRVSSEDAFSAFFPENTCQKRAVFMLVQIKKIAVSFLARNYPSAIEPLLATIGSRLFTLFYIIKVLPVGNERAAFMDEADNLVKQSQLSSHDCGARETAYAVHFALNIHRAQFRFSAEDMEVVLTKSLACIRSCIERELKLSNKERESMYVFQQVMANTTYPIPKLLIAKPVSNN
ncbi:hypothetical protein DSO57_1025703 [Entomophthora muscae]|uniref:Uncharacterized protein n=1 Tax=Entomophthora muscae TaxID=34485 RepID=A0ACC2UBZ8_9FUNG|nr:hypothetical protein DSO57_1025703 [Entomophthora muscae]